MLLRLNIYSNIYKNLIIKPPLQGRKMKHLCQLSSIVFAEQQGL